MEKRYRINFAPIAKLYVVIDLHDRCKCVAAFDTQAEAVAWAKANG